MALFIIGVIVCALVLGILFGINSYDGGDIVIICVLGLIAVGVTSCMNYSESCWWGGDECRKSVAEANVRRASDKKALAARCGRTRLVSTAPDGVQLWVTNEDRDCRNNDGRPVYFSSAGTQTTHTERHGKVTHTYDDAVSNAVGGVR